MKILGTMSPVAALTPHGFQRALTTYGARPMRLLRRMTCFLRLPLLTFAVLLGGPSPGSSQTAGEVNLTYEYNVKAAFLYSFGRYVDWLREPFPHGAGVFVIGVLGDAPFGDALDKIAEVKKIHQRQIVIRRFKSLDEYQPCHILFVAQTVPAKQQAGVIRALQDKPVLLVGETPGFAAQGGTVNFYVDQDTVRFEINAQAAKRQQLSISGKLLSLAKLVKGP